MDTTAIANQLRTADTNPPPEGEGDQPQAGGGVARHMLHGPKRTQKRAAMLRREMTLPEVLLWQELRKRPSGLRFRRQHPAGRYVLDFFCPRRRIAIEVDGEAHGRGDRPERDTARDAWLRARSVQVLRIPAVEILSDLDAVILHITTFVRGDYPSTGFAGPPPPPGED